MVSGAFDVAVVGLGGFGSAAAAALARRGLRVVGFDRHPPGHDRGASHGGTRIIRSAYFEGATYVPLVRAAETLWRSLEAETGAPLLRTAGGVWIGPPDSDLVAGACRSAQAHGIAHEVIDATKLHRRWPVFEPPPGDLAVVEPGAGVLEPEAGVRAHLAVARRHGADLRHDEPVTEWTATQVRSARGTYAVAGIVLAAGAWAPQLLSGLGLPLRVERRVQHWFAPATSAREWSAAPVWIWERADGCSLYGFPAIDGLCKVGIHDAVGPAPAVDPDTLDRTVAPSEVDAVRDLVRPLLPSLASGRHVRSAACTYTLTPDEHFVVGLHPAYDAVAVACGFSGHGYKFTPVIGEVLADLVLHGRTDHDIEAFDPRRTALR